MRRGLRGHVLVRLHPSGKYSVLRTIWSGEYSPPWLNFAGEAQTIARLEHPHIVPLYDYWRDPDGAFLVMRWLPSSLRAALRRGPWAPDPLARLLEQIAGALVVAHRGDI